MIHFKPEILMTLSAIGCLGLAIFSFLLSDETVSDEDHAKYSQCRMIFAFIAKFGISGQFGLVYVYTGELYPTSIRGIATGSCSAGGRIGGILSPEWVKKYYIKSYILYNIIINIY